MGSTNRVVAVCLAALVALACGSSENNGPGATGGQTTSGGASAAGSGGAGAGTAGSSVAGGGATAGSSGNAGSSSGGSGPVLGDSHAEACLAYAFAVCLRRDECRMGPAAHCLSNTFGCPDLVFSPGATRTVEGLQACAETYKTLPCDQVDAEVLPPCVTPGSRTPGETCTYASQCSTLNCKQDADCGVCAREAAIGESCEAPDVACVTGAYCTGTPGVCKAIYPVLPGVGEVCKRSEGCAYGFYCDAALDDGVCKAVPALNESCSVVAACADGLYCSPSSITCQPLPADGEPCGMTGSGPDARAYYCKLGSLCHYDDALATSGTCVALPGAGKPCEFAPDAPEYKYCADGLHCDESLTPAICAASGKPGANCEYADDCDPDLVCACPPDVMDCTTRSCRIMRFGGERCDEPLTACHGSFTCEAGVCKPKGLQGHFETVCSTPP